MAQSPHHPHHCDGHGHASALDGDKPSIVPEDHACLICDWSGRPQTLRTVLISLHHCRSGWQFEPLELHKAGSPKLVTVPQTRSEDPH